MNPIKRKKRFILHLATVVRKLSQDLGINPSDRDYVLRRLHHEGFRFLSKILPLFSKYAITCVDSGIILNAASCGLTSFDTKAGSPLFLRGLLEKAVNNLDGSALYCIRQFCEYFYKLAVSFDGKEISQAEEKFLRNDKVYNETIEMAWVEEGRRAFEVLFPKLSRSNSGVALREHYPHDGPGSYFGSAIIGEPGTVAAVKRYRPDYIRPGSALQQVKEQCDESILPDRAPRGEGEHLYRWREFGIAGSKPYRCRLTTGDTPRPILRSHIRPSNSSSALRSRSRTASLGQPVQPNSILLDWSAFDSPHGVIGAYPANLNHLSGYSKPYYGYCDRKLHLLSNPRWLRCSRDPLFSGRTNQVLFVPKDSRGPRVISKEPLLGLRFQLAFGCFLSSSLEKESRGRINFVDQTVNQELAYRSSIDRNHATLDMADASDRVSLRAVRTIFRNCPLLSDMLRMRSEYSVLPSGELVRLEKFSNMGGGMCFPVLALTVYLSAVLGVSMWRFNNTKASSLRWSATRVYVYGDDLVVPTESYDSVVDSLTRFGLKVNTSKSFRKGHFRESCGKDYLKGVDVTPVRLRLMNGNLSTVDEYRNGNIPILTQGGVLQIERHCRELVEKGLKNLSSYLYKQLAKHLGPLPTVEKTSSALGVYDPYGWLTRPYDYPVTYHPDLDGNPVWRVPESEVAFDSSRHTLYTLKSGVSPRASHVYVPLTRKVSDGNVCQNRALGIALASGVGRGSNFSSVPVRRDVYLKRQVPSLSDLKGYGLATDPELRSSKTFYYSTSTPLVAAVLTYMAGFRG